MQLKLETIKVGGKELPIKCDCYVLAELQKKYGSYTTFEDKLLGRRIVMDEDGYPVRNDDGNYKRERTECDIEAIITMLALCVNTGLDIEGKDPIEEKELIRSVKNPFKLVPQLVKELSNAFKEESEEKKRSPSRSRS